MTNGVRSTPVTMNIVVLCRDESGKVSKIVQTVKDPCSGEEIRLEAGMDGESRVTYMLDGPAPSNEQGAAVACQWLVNALNEQGAHWSNVSPPDETSDVDAFSTDIRDAQRVLNMQCVRAVVDRSYWATLGATGIVTLGKTVDEAADLIAGAIELKVKKLAPAQRSRLTLVLDAVNTPVVTLPSVLTSFVSRHGAKAATFGFQSIWVVGPMPMLISRLA